MCVSVIRLATSFKIVLLLVYFQRLGAITDAYGYGKKLLDIAVIVIENGNLKIFPICPKF